MLLRKVAIHKYKSFLTEQSYTVEERIPRFLALNTIEERINRILEEKRALFETILSGSREKPQKLGLTQDEVFGLFKLKSPKGVINRL